MCVFFFLRPSSRDKPLNLAYRRVFSSSPPPHPPERAMAMIVFFFFICFFFHSEVFFFSVPPPTPLLLSASATTTSIGRPLPSSYNHHYRRVFSSPHPSHPRAHYGNGGVFFLFAFFFLQASLAKVQPSLPPLCYYYYYFFFALVTLW